MNRGEIWECNLGGKVGCRPVLVLTRSAVIPYLSKLVVAEITKQAKDYPTQVPLDIRGRLKYKPYVCCDNLHTIPKERLVKFMAELNPEQMQIINKTIIFALGLV